MRLVDLLLPNRAFRRRLREMDRGARLKYWAVRVAIAVVGILAMLYFGVQQHPQVH